MSETEQAEVEVGATPDQAIPVPATANRIGSLDFIRGIAVLGILAANIIAFGQPFNAYMYPDAFVGSDGDPQGWLWVAQFVLIDGKMRGLFTLLFGAGLALFMDKAWEKGATRWLQARRIFWLMCFGLIHFFLIWRGDILFLYSFAGFIAMLCLRWAAKTQLIMGLLGYVAGAILMGAMLGPLYFVADTPLGKKVALAELRTDLQKGKAEDLADGKTETQILTEGSYADYVAHNIETHGFDPLITLTMFALETLPLMLVGIALYRFGFFTGGLDPGSMRKWGWIGVVVGSVLTLGVALWARSNGLTYYGTLAAMAAFARLPVLPVVLGLAALLTLWGPKATGWLGQRFSAAGRVAFTNYLGTSILMIAVFHPWGLGLFGDLTRPQLYLVVLAAWVTMLLWSKPWLDRFRYGPLEWLWRCLTYWKLFPIKR